ncbi:hypothetical protein K2Y11_22150 [bacterium]|nr:hypothetical protein [bacterium]
MDEKSSSLALLAERIRSIERTSSAVCDRLSSGNRILDDMLPGGGFRPGGIIEWISEKDGTGAWSLALIMAQKACRDHGILVVIDRHHEFYPVPMLQAGWASRHLLLIRPQTEKEELWAWEHVLRCRGVAAVMGLLRKGSSRTMRRLQLAAESGLGIGLLLRPKEASAEPSWGDARVQVEPLPSDQFARPPDSLKRFLRLTLLYARGGIAGRSVEVSWDEEANTLSLASRLGDSTPTRHSVSL